MAGNKKQARKKQARVILLRRVGVLLAAGVLLWVFPPFHIVAKTHSAGSSGTAASSVSFDAKKAAEKVWSTELPAGLSKANDLLVLAKAVQTNAEQARTQHGKQSGLGATYFFAHGTGRVISREGSRLRLALDDKKSLIVELRVGPIFGNTVRDGCGLLNVNSFPGLQEFNALSAELNTLIEGQVLPALRDKALVGSSITFTGCAEAPENTPSAEAPLLVFIPIKAEVR